eukprot:TRINITY_DN2009_c0_g1_i1.p1 TRINITY_DN2009_c0_g1~~TRINITY_DN2009_c0_g1_i1.p1  ORF type:complete len:740 (+),score=158.63 TRINITY_DN2009_c0_g1_i1:74-2293(+)
MATHGLSRSMQRLSIFQMPESSQDAADLARGQLKLQELKKNISVESRKNYALERQIRILDQKIALLVKNRISLEEAEAAATELAGPTNEVTRLSSDRQKSHYESLFFLLQNEPQYMAGLTRLIKTNEIDSLLQIVMFTLYGNQYDAREEHLLLQMFQRVLKHEFDNATGMGSLLRANTAITRMMTTYTRRGPGQSYLKATLSGILSWLIRSDINLEINPMKVYESMINDDEAQTGQPSPLPRNVTAEVAAENPRVKGIIEPRVPILQETAQKFLETIIGSLPEIPYGIRYICKQIYSLTKAKFPQATRSELTSLAGGFLLLRFINPAIVTPTAYMLVDSKPGANARKNLTYLAKMLQNLSNGANFGEKESYMEHVNGFVVDNREKLADFFDKLVDVEDPEKALEMDEIMGLTKTDLQLNISVNEIYSVHALLQAHNQTLCPDPSNPLRRILNDLGPDVPEQVPRPQNGIVNLHLYDRFGTKKVEEPAQKHVNEQLYIETKCLMINIFQQYPDLSIMAEAQDLVALLTSQLQMPRVVSRPKVADNMRKVIASLQKLAPDFPAECAENYAKFRKEALEEMSNFAVYHAKIHKEIQSLDSVYQTIKSHNQYLQDQFSTYQMYLVNVREKAYNPRDSKSKSKASAVKEYKFTHVQLEKDGIIIESEVPENKKSNVYFLIASSSPGVFTVQVHYKGVLKPIFETQLTLDDLLENQHNNELEVDMEHVRLSTNLLIHLLRKSFAR